MNKGQLIQRAASLGIEVKESTFGIFNPIDCYAVELKKPYDSFYFVTDDRTRPALLRGIRIIAERAKVQLPAGFSG